MGDYNDAFMRNKDAAVQARTKAQNRSNVLQLKLIGQGHPTGLTTNLLKLFEPRPPLEFKPPIEKRKPLPYTGMAQCVSHFAEPGDPEYAPAVKEAETPVERRARIQKIRLEKGVVKAAEELQKYDPHKDPNATGDPYKTLFVARLNYETTEHRMKREFEAYGPIKRVRLVTDIETNKPRGYAFIEYMHTRDMKSAYKQADGRKLDNRRVLVDVERGRTVPNWRPRRLGGGLGSTRIGGEDLNQKNSGRELQQIAPGGGHGRSEEPRAREEHHVDREREKSRDRGRDRDREKSRDREARVEDRHHHRDRERTRDRDRDRSVRDRDRDRDSLRGGRDRDRDRGRDYEKRDWDRDRGHRASHERDRVPTAQGTDGAGVGDMELEPGEHEYGREEYYEEKPVKNEHGYYEGDDDKEHDRHHRVKREVEYYDGDKYGGEYGREESEQREEGEAVGEQDYGYQRSERSRSREYER